MPRLLNRNSSRGFASAALVIALSGASALPAQADTFTLHGVFNGTTTDPGTGTGTPVITDTLNAGPGGANILTANEPFTLTGIFDPSNVVFHLPPGSPTGFSAYSPESVTLTVGGTTYSVETFGENATSGFTVAIFDGTFMPGHVGAGFLANPPMDGAGIISDWLTSSPPFLLPTLVNASYTTANYFGVGFGSGPCPPPGFNPDGTCISGEPNTVVPIPLNGGSFELTLGTYDLNNPSNMIPQNPNDNLFSAELTVPEPSTWAMMFIGFAGLAIAGLRSARKERLAA